MNAYMLTRNVNCGSFNNYDSLSLFSNIINGFAFNCQLLIAKYRLIQIENSDVKVFGFNRPFVSGSGIPIRIAFQIIT